MITELGVFILGLISETPMNPYEIAKFAEQINMQNWLQTPKQSVYSAIKSLDKKGYIIGERVRAGNYPDKTVYSITEEGTTELEIALEEFLKNMQWNFSKFNLASIFLCHMEQEKVLNILAEKEVLLNEKLIQLKENYVNLTNQNIPKTGLHAVRHMEILTQSEMESVRELMSLVNEDKEWNHFLVKDESAGRGK